MSASPTAPAATNKTTANSKDDTLLAEPTFFHWIKECMHQIISVILRYLKRLLLNVIV